MEVDLTPELGLSEQGWEVKANPASGIALPSVRGSPWNVPNARGKEAKISFWPRKGLYFLSRGFFNHPKCFFKLQILLGPIPASWIKAVQHGPGPCAVASPPGDGVNLEKLCCGKWDHCRQKMGESQLDSGISI